MRHRVSTYKELAKWSEAFVEGTFGLFFLIGSPGHAKSFTIRKLIKDEQEATKKRREKEKKVLATKKKTKPAPTDPDFEKRPDGHVAEPLWVEGGAVSAFKLYLELYMHLDETVVLDDVDSVYSDRNLVRLLKALCQTEKVKTIGWHTDNRQLDNLGIPNKYKTRSRVAIIANHWKHLSEHVGALMSRGVMIEFDPSVQEVFNYIKANKIITDKEVLDFASKHLWMVERIDIRDFLNAVDAKKAKLDWQDALAQSMGIRDMLLVDKLTKDKSFTSDTQRDMQFSRLTGQSRPMWFKAKNQLQAIKNARAGKPEPSDQKEWVMA